MTRWLAVIVLVLLTAGAWAQDAGAAPTFVTVHLHVDGGDQAVAAWQAEWMGRDAGVTVVGIEGGSHPTFARPPYYDPQALGQGRLVLAAYSLDPDLPAGDVHVATLHVMVDGGSLDQVRLRLITAVDATGEPVSASLRLLPASGAP